MKCEIKGCDAEATWHWGPFEGRYGHVCSEHKAAINLQAKCLVWEEKPDTPKTVKTKPTATLEGDNAKDTEGPDA